MRIINLIFWLGLLISIIGGVLVFNPDRYWNGAIFCGLGLIIMFIGIIFMKDEVKEVVNL